MQLPFILGFVLLSGCDPLVTRPATDARSAELVESKWSLYSEDSMYMSNGSPVYIERIPFLSCTDTLYFQSGMHLTQNENCPGQPANVLLGSWYWPLNDSLNASLPAAGLTLKSLRFTGDTLQLWDTSNVPGDKVSGKPVYFVKTYTRN